MGIEAHHNVQLLPKPEVSEALVAARVVVVVERAHIAKYPACSPSRLGVLLDVLLNRFIASKVSLIFISLVEAQEAVCRPTLGVA